MPLIIGIPTARGLQIAASIQKAYDVSGTTYRYGRSGSSFNIKGRLALSPFSDYSARFTAVETAGWARPVYLLRIAGAFLVPGGGAPILGDTVDLPATTRSSASAPEFVTYSVRGVFYDTTGDVITLTRLYLARNS